MGHVAGPCETNRLPLDCCLIREKVQAAFSHEREEVRFTRQPLSSCSQVCFLPALKFLLTRYRSWNYFPRTTPTSKTVLLLLSRRDMVEYKDPLIESWVSVTLKIPEHQQLRRSLVKEGYWLVMKEDGGTIVSKGSFHCTTTEPIRTYCKSVVFQNLFWWQEDAAKGHMVSREDYRLLTGLLSEPRLLKSWVKSLSLTTSGGQWANSYQAYVGTTSKLFEKLQDCLINPHSQVRREYSRIHKVKDWDIHHFCFTFSLFLYFCV